MITVAKHGSLSPITGITDVNTFKCQTIQEPNSMCIGDRELCHVTSKHVMQDVFFCFTVLKKMYVYQEFQNTL